MVKRFCIISLFIILFIAFITIWNFSYEKGLEDAYIPVVKNETVPIIPLEKGVFKRFDNTLDYSKMPVDENHQRSLKTYYNNRAFYGAPPAIPHQVESDRTMGDKTCLKCHQNGGFVEKFQAYTPITPHPEMVNCRQCHLPQQSKSLFVSNDFNKGTIPTVGNNNALLGSPPSIPHQLQLRENCLSCHAGPSAPKEIRVTHPERINCRQCHLPSNKLTENIGFFTKKLKLMNKYKVTKNIIFCSLVMFLITSCNKHKEEYHTVVDKIEAKSKNYKGTKTSSKQLIDFKNMIEVTENEITFFIPTRKDKITSFKCTECHSKPLAKMQKKDIKKAHWNITINHANTNTMNCITCHDGNDMNKLKSITGHEIDFNKSYKLCSQCHQQQYKDWTGGAHGKKIESWASPRASMTCVNCHNPHSPQIESKWPEIFNTQKVIERK